jgi:hypothetical protein
LHPFTGLELADVRPDLFPYRVASRHGQEPRLGIRRIVKLRRVARGRCMRNPRRFPSAYRIPIPCSLSVAA